MPENSNSKPDLLKSDKKLIKSELGMDSKQLDSLLKKLKSIENRDDKAFMDMLRTSSRNHYTLNQMVDRKARILLSANVLIISAIVGQAATQGTIVGVNSTILLLVGITALLSMLLSLFAVVPEKSHGKLDSDSFKNMDGNPLYFGNYVRMPEAEYENSMMEMVNNRDFIYRALIQDTFHLGKSLERKRRILRWSLFIFVAGLSISFAVACVIQLETLR